MLLRGVHVSEVSEPCSHFLIAVAATIHEIEESALPDSTRCEVASNPTMQLNDADVLMIATDDADAVVSTAAAAETSRVRAASIDALAAIDAAASALRTRCAAEVVLAAHDAVADALLMATTEAVDADVTALVALTTRRRLPTAVVVDEIVAAADAVTSLLADADALETIDSAAAASAMFPSSPKTLTP